MGVVGFGGTGRAMARRAVAFGMQVLACDVMAVAPSDGVAAVWAMDRLDELLAASDVVAIGAPLTDETRHLFDDARFAAMKPGLAARPSAPARRCAASPWIFTRHDRLSRSPAPSRSAFLSASTSSCLIS